MKSSSLVTTSLLLAFSFVGNSAFGYVNSIKNFKKGLLEVGVFSKYSYSDANYASGGTTSNLNSGYSFQALDADIVGRFSFDDIAYYAGATVSNAQSKNNINSRVNSTLSAAILGLEYHLMDRYLDLTGDLGAVIPTDKISDSADVVINADYVTVLRAGLTLQRQFGAAKFFARTAYVSRETRSTLFDWGTGFDFNFGTYSTGLELAGITSIKDDSDAGTFKAISRQAAITKVNAGSLMYYSVNPSYIDLTAALKFNFNKVDRLEFLGGGTLTGSNYASNFHVGANVIFGYDFGWKKTKPYESHMSTDEVNDSKEETSDGVDQRLFSPPSPATSSKKEVTPIQTDEELQKQLDDTEVQINLKSNKKKKKR